MIKKLQIFVFALLIVGCTAKKPVVRTTQNTPKTRTVTTKHTPTTAAKKEESKTSREDKTTESEILEATTQVKVTNAIVLEYINQYKGIAKNNMVEYNIPASIILAQGILESGAGTGPLSTMANNHFGIKCHKEWTGPSVRYDDDEEKECFRKYAQASESYKDHSLFLTSRPWYQPLFLLKIDDYKSWAKGLKTAGYATDPKYPEKLIGLIDRYQLNQYDAEVLGKSYVSSKTKEENVNKANVYEVIKGDTLYSISKKFNISIEDLKKKNDISSNSISIGQNLIIK